MFPVVSLHDTDLRLTSPSLLETSILSEEQPNFELPAVGSLHLCCYYTASICLHRLPPTPKHAPSLRRIA